MKTRQFIFRWISAAAGALLSGAVLAQDVAPPLNFQNVDRSAAMGARTRAMGGAGVAAGSGLTGMFVNPATLGGLANPEVRVGGHALLPFDAQTQEWHPDRLYAELSLLLENRLGGILNWPADTAGHDTLVTLKHAYDNIGPDWSRHSSAARPGLLAAGLPLASGENTLAVAVGYSEVMDLEYYYQNNNALDPNVGQMRPAPINRLTSKNDSLPVHWYQYRAQREGGVYGITPAIAAGIGPHFRFGLSATILTGSTDDRVERTERGLITLRATSASTYNVFTVDSIAERRLASGTSSFSGTSVTLGFLWKSETYAAGIAICPAHTMTRDWSTTVTTDSMGTSSSGVVQGTDKLDVPLSAAVGLALYPGEKVVVGLDYEIRNNAGARFLQDTAVVQPWVDSRTFKLGIEYFTTKWLTLRGGYREDVRSTVAAGAAILDEPIKGSIYSAGFGIVVGPWNMDLAYEYGLTKFYDAWESNINRQTNERHNVLVDFGYRF